MTINIDCFINFTPYLKPEVLLIWQEIHLEKFLN